MVLINRVKLLLSKITIAQGNYKKILKIKLYSVDLVTLKLLWKNSFIYGFKKIKDLYFIFLKYNAQGLGIFTSIKFLNKHVCRKELQNLLAVNPYRSYFILMPNGFFFFPGKTFIKNNIKFKSGGILVAKL